jgi:hypothetical protein
VFKVEISEYEVSRGNTEESCQKKKQLIKGKKDYVFMLQRSRTEGLTSRRVIVG